MKLYLVRHGHAIAPDRDPTSPLSPTGRIDTEEVAKSLTQIKTPVVWHSSKLRARQTAELLMPQAERVEKEGLKPNDAIEPIFSEILSMDQDLMIVSHLPFLDKLFYALNSGHEVTFDNTTVVALEKKGGRWVFCWSLTPKKV